jgi:hypothetical protein
MNASLFCTKDQGEGVRGYIGAGEICLEGKEGAGSPDLCQNRGITAAGAAYSDEKFHRPDSGLEGRKEGEGRGGCGDFIGSNEASFYCFNQ